MKLQVDESFVREAYNEACDKWKKKISDQFPDLKLSGIFNKIKDLPAYAAYRRFVSKDIVEYEVGDALFIELNLPNANREWSIAAWNLAKEICQISEYYPVHSQEIPYNILKLKKYM